MLVCVVVVLDEVVVSVIVAPVPRPVPLAFALRLTFTPPTDKFIFRLTFSSGTVPVVVVVVVVVNGVSSVVESARGAARITDCRITDS